MPTIYVAGPVSGLPELNHPAFHEATAQLMAAGYTVLNPIARAGATPGQTWEWYMKKCLIDVAHADGMALLPGWTESRGASLEAHIADALGMPTGSVQGWVDLARSGD